MYGFIDTVSVKDGYALPNSQRSACHATLLGPVAAFTFGLPDSKSCSARVALCIACSGAHCDKKGLQYRIRGISAMSLEACAFVPGQGC